MDNTVSIRARFKNCNIKDGETVMQFALDPEFKGALPSLAMMTGTSLLMQLTSEQQVLFGNDGEVLEGQEEAFADDAPRELPPSAYEVSDDEADEGEVWHEEEWPPTEDDDESLAA